MTNDAHSGSRWDPEQRRHETAEQPAVEHAVPLGPPPVGGSTGAVAPATALRKKRALAALAAAGLVLVGGAGGWAIGSAAAGTDTPAVVQPGTGGTPGPHDREPDFGGRGGMPDLDRDDGSIPPDGSTDDGSTDGTGDPA